MSTASGLLSAEVRAQLKLALPLCAAHLGQHLMGVVDAAMLGHHSGAALAGAGVANAALLAITVLGAGTVMGLDTLIPQALGAGDPRRARALVRRGVWVAFAIGVPLTAAAAALPAVLSAIVAPGVAEQATVYTYGRLPAIIPFLLFTAQRSFLQSHGITRPIVIAMVAANALNIGLDGVLVFGDGALELVGLPPIGLPALGALGAAITTSTVTWVATGVAALAVARVPGPRERRASDRALAGPIVRIGFPVGLQLLAEVGLFALTSAAAGRLGEVAGAAHQIGVALASFTFSLALGAGAATSVRVGRAIGAGDTPGARRAGAAGAIVVLALMSGGAVAFAGIPGAIAGLMTGDPAVVAVAAPLLRIAAVFQLSDGLQAVASGALRGVGHTRATFVGHIIGLYGVGAPVAVGLTFGVGLGAPGLWWGLFAGLTVVAALLAARFRQVTSRPIPRRLG